MAAAKRRVIVKTYDERRAGALFHAMDRFAFKHGGNFVMRETTPIKLGKSPGDQRTKNAGYSGPGILRASRPVVASFHYYAKSSDARKAEKLHDNPAFHPSYCDPDEHGAAFSVHARRLLKPIIQPRADERLAKLFAEQYKEEAGIAPAIRRRGLMSYFKNKLEEKRASKIEENKRNASRRLYEGLDGE